MRIKSIQKNNKSLVILPIVFFAIMWYNIIREKEKSPETIKELTTMKKYTIENANEIIAGIPDNDTYNSIKDALFADGYKLKTIDIDNFVYFFSNGVKIIAVYRF